jgi:hypothetical protein
MLRDFAADAHKIIYAERSQRTPLQLAYLASITLLLLGILPWPYEFYNILRVAVFACSISYFTYMRKVPTYDGKWMYVLGALTIIYNPIIPIHLGVQGVWTVINLVTIALLYQARLVIERTANDPNTASGRNTIVGTQNATSSNQPETDTQD